MKKPIKKVVKRLAPVAVVPPDKTETPPIKPEPPMPKEVLTPTHLLKVRGTKITFVDLATKEEVSKTYDTKQGVRIICGRAAIDPVYLKAVLVKIQTEIFKKKMQKQ